MGGAAVCVSVCGWPRVVKRAVGVDVVYTLASALKKVRIQNTVATAAAIDIVSLSASGSRRCRSFAVVCLD